MTPLKRMYLELYKIYQEQKPQPIHKEFVAKAWDDNGVTRIEGWISTPDLDIEREVTEPEAFANSLDGLFERGAPISSKHDTIPYPVGHLQKAVLIRDGVVFKSAQHPTDPAEFENLPTSGTGMYACGVINNPTASQQVKSGNVRSFSYTGYVKKAEKFTNGVRRFLEIDPLIETCIAAYPVNPSAKMTITK